MIKLIYYLIIILISSFIGVALGYLFRKLYDKKKLHVGGPLKGGIYFEKYDNQYHMKHIDWEGNIYDIKVEFTKFGAVFTKENGLKAVLIKEDWIHKAEVRKELIPYLPAEFILDINELWRH